MRLAILILISTCFVLTAGAQTGSSQVYSENDFVEYFRGIDPSSSNELFAIWMRHNQDSALVLKQTFLDSSYNQLVAKAFIRENVLVGPFLGYTAGSLIFKANYKYGKLDGEALTYSGGKVTQRAHYFEGTKVGLWEEYDQDGNPLRKITYDAKGRMISEEKF